MRPARTAVSRASPHRRAARSAAAVLRAAALDVAIGASKQALRAGQRLLAHAPPRADAAAAKTQVARLRRRETRDAALQVSSAEAPQPLHPLRSPPLCR